MKKLINGIVEFRRTVRPAYRKTFAKLAIEQKPDSFFLACSDSRVVPNLFVSTDPGDLFVARNVGNLVPPFDTMNFRSASAAALEYAVLHLDVKNVIVCGHSECGAMKALLAHRSGPAGDPETSALARWLEFGRPALQRMLGGERPDPTLTEHNQLSQVNVLQQLDNVLGYPFVAERVAEGKLSLHAWWFDLGHADVYAYENTDSMFVLIDETEAARILERLEAAGAPTKGRDSFS